MFDFLLPLVYNVAIKVYLVRVFVDVDRDPPEGDQYAAQGVALP